MTSLENPTHKGIEAEEENYVHAKSDNYSAEKEDIGRPEAKLKRQLKNRHVAMIRSVM